MDFVTITSNNNWFKRHPEKIAGVEYETTSFFFPIQVKGTKEDVLRVIGGISNQAIPKPSPSHPQAIAKSKAKAKAIQIRLKLLKL